MFQDLIIQIQAVNESADHLQKILQHEIEFMQEIMNF